MSRDVVLYTRRLCGLCDEAADELRRLQPRLGFELRELDIDEDADLRARYNDVIPVIMLDGELIAQAPIERTSLERALTAALASG